MIPDLDLLFAYRNVSLALDTTNSPPEHLPSRSESAFRRSLDFSSIGPWKPRAPSTKRIFYRPPIGGVASPETIIGVQEATDENIKIRNHSDRSDPRGNTLDTSRDRSRAGIP